MIYLCLIAEEREWDVFQVPKCLGVFVDDESSARRAIGDIIRSDGARGLRWRPTDYPDEWISGQGPPYRVLRLVKANPSGDRKGKRVERPGHVDRESDLVGWFAKRPWREHTVEDVANAFSALEEDVTVSLERLRDSGWISMDERNGTWSYRPRKKV